MTLEIEYCGEVVPVGDGESLGIGREAELVIDDNLFLHRRFLQVSRAGQLWYLSNVGSQLTATVSDAGGQMEAFLAPGASIPLVFERTVVSFMAGPTFYELAIRLQDPVFQPPITRPVGEGALTIGPAHLLPDQHLLILALAEPRLRGDGRASVSIPTSQAAAHRLGWTITKFNRKLDYLCARLSELGVRGIYGGKDGLAANRRSRLVEYAIATRMVNTSELPLLDRAEKGSDLDEPD